MKCEFTFLGGMLPHDKEQSAFLNSKGSFQAAANILQWRFIEGIEAAIKKPMRLLSAPFLGSYPKNNKQLFIRSYEFSHNENVTDNVIGYCNLTVAKQFFYKRAVNKVINKYCANFQKDTMQILFVYSATFISEIKYIKRKYPKLFVCMIVPDLPNFTSLDSPNRVLLQRYNVYRRENFNSIIREDIIDHFVFLTKWMAFELGVPDEKYTVIEGIAEQPDIKQILNNTSNKTIYKDIVYTGTLALRYGVLNLIDAFKAIKGDQYRLIICGGGGESDIVRDASKSDNRIQFMGLVNSATAKQIQQKATVLVNPRPNNEAYTKFSFPSKILEYLSTCHPVVCYKLDGIPDEYKDILLFASEHENGLKIAIEKALLMTEQEKYDYAIKIYDFLSAQKTSEKQCAKLISNLQRGIEEWQK